MLQLYTNVHIGVASVHNRVTNVHSGVITVHSSVADNLSKHLGSKQFIPER